METLSVIIPVFNEAASIERVLTRILELEWPTDLKFEVIVVDDGSNDGSGDIIQDYHQRNPGFPMVFLRKEANTGKGSALHLGLQAATGEYLLIQDADLEYHPSDYPDLLAPLRKGYADAVFGSRFVGGKPHRVLLFWHFRANRFLTWVSNAVNDLNLTDMMCCYKLFRRELLERITLREKGFGFEAEVAAKISRLPLIRIFEVGVAYYGRSYAEGKKIKWTDGLVTLRCIFQYGLGWKSSQF